MTNEQINYKKIISDYPWIIEKRQKYILSPDSDGFLCGLLVTNYLDGEIVGFYDGKICQMTVWVSVCKNCGHKNRIIYEVF